jgi:SET domain-containing protein
MMLVRCHVAPSPIHGLGLFLDEPVSKGQIVWKFNGSVDRILPRSLKPYSFAFKEFVAKYSYLDHYGRFILCGDLAIFMNHSETPTLVGYSTDYAARDLAVGDEMTCDYRDFDMDWRRKLGIV